MKKTLFVLIVIAFSCTEEKIPAEKKDFVYDRPYKVEILNDHQVQCTNSGDTIQLYLENAYALSEEVIVFIEKK